MNVQNTMLTLTNILFDILAFDILDHRMLEILHEVIGVLKVCILSLLLLKKHVEFHRICISPLL